MRGWEREGEDGEEGREKVSKDKVSKDKVINRLGVELVEVVKWVEEEGWGIINGVKEGDKEEGDIYGKEGKDGN